MDLGIWLPITLQYTGKNRIQVDQPGKQESAYQLELLES